MSASQPRSTRGLAARVLVLVALGPAAAQGQREEPPSPATEQESAPPLWFATTEEIELASLLDALSTAFDVPLEYDRSKVTGTVSLRSGPGISAEGIWAMTHRLLAARGLACIQGAGEDALGIVEMGKAAQLARTEAGELGESWAGYVKVLRSLRQIEPAPAAAVLKNVLTGDGSLVQPVPEARQVILAGLRPQVEEALAVLDALERPAIPPAIEEIETEHLSPTVIVSLLERITAAWTKVAQAPPRGTLLANPSSSRLILIAPAEEVETWREMVARFDQAETMVTVNYRPRRFGLEETAKLIEDAVHPGAVAGEPGWRMVRDELTGTLIVTTTYSRHREIEALLARLESADPDTRRSVRAFSIEQRDVDEMLELLQGLMQRGPLPDLPGLPGGAGSAQEGSAPAPEGRTGGAVERIATPEVTLAKDEGTNRILAIGEPWMLEELGRLIESLDVRHPQVLVEVLLASLSEGQTRDLAVELQKFGEVDGGVGRLSSLFAAGSPDPAGVAFPAPAGIGLEGVLLDPGDFSAIVRALETVSEGRTLSIPKVLVNNNQTASLNSVLQRPFTSTNASDTVATTSFGGTQDAGTVVSVTPQITDGDQLLLEYSVSISSFVGQSADPTLPPPRQENLLESTATIPDGYAVVVGGLEIEAESDAVSRVPFLGDLPLLGALFRSSVRERSRDRFFVFLRCTVLRSPAFEDLKYLSEADLAEARVGDGLPELTPRLIR